MTNEEAHAFLEKQQSKMKTYRHFYTEEAIETNALAIAAIKKQIPKKPVPSVLYDAKFWCVCGFGIKRQYEDTMFKIQYCPWCGQRLDWSE